MTSHDHNEQTHQAPASAEGHQDTEALLQAEIETLKAELEQLRASALLERADLDNQRKRVARDVENARKFANEKLLGQLLPVFDSLDAGLTAAGTEPSPLREGLELTRSSCSRSPTTTA